MRGDAIPVISFDVDPESVASGWGCHNYLFVIPIPAEHLGLPVPDLLKDANAAIWSLRASRRPHADPAQSILPTGPQEEARWNMARIPSKTATAAFTLDSAF